MNKIISYILVALSLLLLLAPDYILAKDSTNSIIKTIYDYHQMIGGLGVMLSYYVYNGTYIPNEEYDTVTMPSIESNVNSK